MLPFSPFPILLITLNTMLVAYSEIFFYLLLIAVRRIFILDKFLLQDHFTSGYNPMVRI